MQCKGISKNGKNIEEDDDDSNSRIVFNSIEEWEEILSKLETNDYSYFHLY